jgi:hypothetical protein
MLSLQPKWAAWRNSTWKQINIGHDKLVVNPDTAAQFGLIARLSDSYAPNGRASLAAPSWLAAYAAFERKSPMWAIYALWPKRIEFQEKEIQRIRDADPRFAVVMDLPLDGREELCFRNVWPLIDQYISNNFDLAANLTAPPLPKIYRSREGSPPVLQNQSN